MEEAALQISKGRWPASRVAGDEQTEGQNPGERDGPAMNSAGGTAASATPCMRWQAGRRGDGDLSVIFRLRFSPQWACGATINILPSSVLSPQPKKE